MRRLPRHWTPEVCFRRLAPLGGCVWLDSAPGPIQGGDIVPGSPARYSYLAAEPFSKVRIDQPRLDSLLHIAKLGHQYYQPKLLDLPPMQGGWMGWLGYELGGAFERVPTARKNDFHLPVAALGLYDVVLSWDHASGESWIISQGWPVTEPQGRAKQAYRRLRRFLDILEKEPQPLPEEWRQARQFTFPAERLVEQFATRWNTDWTSNFSPELFRGAVARAVEYIHAGDIFQVNLAQRLLRRAHCGSEELYLHLRHQNPAPMAGYADFGRIQVLSCSPERFVELLDGRIETRPIKGTRPRLSDPLADAGMGELLRSSDKDRSENVMIVDLLRNDLSRVADPNSVRVTQLCGLERYPFVWHLVSAITARLARGQTAVDLLAATFPGGSITGAPKIRAMQIIAELEPTVRGPYCGSLGYLSFAGDMDSNILIRTITACDGWWQVPVGGGIVADSDPQLEEQETWHKAEGILRAIDSIQGSQLERGTK